MKKVFYILAFMLATIAYGTEKPYFLYGDVHAMGGYPMVGVGVRVQNDIHVFDFSGNIFPLPHVYPSPFHLKGLYLISPQKMGFYFGGGLGILNEPETIRISGSFEAAIGYQWKNRIFLEGNATAPFKQSQALVPVYPGLTLGFGF